MHFVCVCVFFFLGGFTYPEIPEPILVLKKGQVHKVHPCTVKRHAVSLDVTIGFCVIEHTHRKRWWREKAVCATQRRRQHSVRALKRLQEMVRGA